MKKNKKIILIILSCLLLIFSVFYIAKIGSHQETIKGTSGTDSTTRVESVEEDAQPVEIQLSASDSQRKKTSSGANSKKPVKKETGPKETLLFASDYQYENGWAQPEETYVNIINTIQNDGKEITGVLMCGDYSNVPKKYNHQISPESTIKRIKQVSLGACSSLSEEKLIFVQGNHDAMCDEISETGLHEYDNYLVYVLNTQYDFPWSQGKTKGALATVEKAAQNMDKTLTALAEKGETRPIFIAGHVPLHYTARVSSKHTTGDNLYSTKIFDVVNKAAENLDIIYVFGHNHSKGWDCYLGGACVYKAIGDTLILPVYDGLSNRADSFHEEKLKFTYLNAGYVGYYMNCSETELNNGSKEQYDVTDIELTETICEIYDDKLVLTRYDKNGVHNIGSDGCANPYKNFDEGLIPSSFYNRAVRSSQTLYR